MARRPRAARIENRSNRLKLAPRRKPYEFTPVAAGVAVGYRRTISGSGTWVMRKADGRGGSWTRGLGNADDYQAANGDSVLDFWQAQDKAKALAGVSEGEAAPITVAQAIDRHELDLQMRGRSRVNATTFRRHVPPSLATKAVALVSSRELRDWRDGLVKAGLNPSTATRYGKSLKAALNLVAAGDPRITNSAAWRTGLEALPDAENSNNVILPDNDVCAVVAAAYQISPAFGLVIELAATCGARASQLFRTTVADLQDGPTPRLLVPSSHKGRRRRVEHKPLPIPPVLAAKLRVASAARPSHAPLLVDDAGTPWTKIDVPTFRRACVMAGLDPTLVPYSLRHSSIVRQLLAGIPIRVVASAHDTSVVMLEKTYSRRIIGDPSDAMVRRALLDIGGSPPAGNVVKLKA